MNTKNHLPQNYPIYKIQINKPEKFFKLKSHKPLSTNLPKTVLINHEMLYNQKWSMHKM